MAEAVDGDEADGGGAVPVVDTQGTACRRPPPPTRVEFRKELRRVDCGTGLATVVAADPGFAAVVGDERVGGALDGNERGGLLIGSANTRVGFDGHGGAEGGGAVEEAGGVEKEAHDHLAAVGKADADHATRGVVCDDLP